MSESQGERPAPTEAELQALQAAEEAKADPALDDVEAAPIDAPEPEGEREEPFEKLAAQARRMSPERARTVLEALLFLAERPLGVEEVRRATGLEPARISRILDELAGHYREGVSGIVLQEVGGGWQFRTSPDTTEFARRFLRVKPQRLTRAALETLAIVAYRQPVTRPEVDAIRGVNSDSPLDTLLQYELVCEAGRKEAPGRPLLYRTTDSFLGRFGLNSIADLPGLDTIPTDETEIRAAAASVSLEEDPGEASLEPSEPAQDEPPAVVEETPGPDTQEPSPA
jgi:segregation and condensation protein B